MARSGLLVSLAAIALTVGRAHGGFLDPVEVGTLRVGLEDIGLPAGDRDYNDAIIALSGAGLDVVGQGAWQPMTAPNRDGSRFWDNTSWDGADHAVGYHIEPGSGYWGVGPLADRDFMLSAAGTVSVTLVSEDSAWQDQNALYWVDAQGSHLLFSGSSQTGWQGTFQPAGPFSLLWVTPGGRFSSLGQGDQFALFRNSHNPEPGALALVAGGLLLIARRRRCGRVK
jgi:hypothetical protein